MILFGLDKDNRPHAASFDEQSAKLAQKAAEILKFQILLIETPEQRELAYHLPPGSILSAGKGAVPLVRKDLFNRLLSLLPGAEGHPAASPADGSGSAEGQSGEIVGSSKPQPTTWSEIEVGDLVLVDDPGDAMGWYEAIVLEQLGGDQFKLQHRDYPDDGIYVRPRSKLALLPLVLFR